MTSSQREVDEKNKEISKLEASLNNLNNKTSNLELSKNTSKLTTNLAENSQIPSIIAIPATVDAEGESKATNEQEKKDVFPTEATFLLGIWEGSYRCKDEFGTGELTWEITKSDDGALQVAEESRRLGWPSSVKYDAFWNNKSKFLRLLTEAKGGYEINVNPKKGNKELNGKYIRHPSCSSVTVKKVL